MTHRRLLFVIALAWLCGACGSVPVERFYSLDALEPADAMPATVRRAVRRLAVGPVNLPERLDRPQLVWRDAAQQLVIAEQSRWAEPLSAAIARVVADNLARQLPGVLPVVAHSDADLRIELDIRRFDAERGRAVTLEAVWALRGDSVVRQGHLRLREEVADASIAALAAAHARALRGLGRDIANALR